MRSGNRLTYQSGPSPRGWGAHPGMLQKYSGMRTIPTRVGSTRSTGPSTQEASDHPHAGGEHHLGKYRNPRNCGPSPRGWGAHARLIYRRDVKRTIPTRVGSTKSSACRPCSKPDHPHAGGEHIILRADALADYGPSPRGWGAPAVKREIVMRERTIPTRVGSTTAPGLR